MRANRLLFLALLCVASCAGDCDGCSCKGSNDVESARSESAEPSSSPSRRSPEEPEGEDPTTALAVRAATGSTTVIDPTGAQPAEPEDEPEGAGTTVLDRPTSGQVGVVLRDMRERVATECARGGVRRSVAVELTISGRSGRATQARAIGPSAGTAEAACVEALMREAQFPTFERNEVRAAYAYRIPGSDPDGGASLAAGADAGAASAIDPDAGDAG